MLQNSLFGPTIARFSVLTREGNASAPQSTSVSVVCPNGTRFLITPRAWHIGDVGGVKVDLRNWME